MSSAIARALVVSVQIQCLRLLHIRTFVCELHNTVPTRYICKLLRCFVHNCKSLTEFQNWKGVSEIYKLKIRVATKKEKANEAVAIFRQASIDHFMQAQDILVSSTAPATIKLNIGPKY